MGENHIHLSKCPQNRVANNVDPTINPDDAQHMKRNV